MSSHHLVCTWKPGAEQLLSTYNINLTLPLLITSGTHAMVWKLLMSNFNLEWYTVQIYNIPFREAWDCGMIRIGCRVVVCIGNNPLYNTCTCNDRV